MRATGAEEDEKEGPWQIRNSDPLSLSLCVAPSCGRFNRHHYVAAAAFAP